MKKKQFTPWLWVCAAFLVASTRLTEWGLSLDPALFATVARSLAQDNQWWSLHATPSLFPQFYEHPFLAIWIQACVFKLFGASDLTARLVGLSFGCFTFYYLFRLGEQLVDETYANVLCFLTLVSVHFTGRIPTFYLDVPLCFFLVGGVFYFLRMLQTEQLWEGIACGLFLGAAVLTKGLAALPVFALCFLVGLVKRRQYLFQVPVHWVAAALAVGIPLLCILLQNRLGTYSFLDLYLARFRPETMAQKASTFYFIRVFTMEFLKVHAVHMVLAFVGVGLWVFRRLWVEECREALWVGSLALILLLVANSGAAAINLHYFYGIFPFANLLAATALYPAAKRYSSFSWVRAGWILGLVYQMVWHVIPLSMRRKPDIDFFDLRAPVYALKKAGVERLESFGIDRTDWAYREMSAWYWEMDTVIRTTTHEIQGAAVILPNEKKAQFPQMKLCRTSKKYTLLVQERLEETCKAAVLDPRLLR